MAAMTRYLEKPQDHVAAGVALLKSPIALKTLIGTSSKPTLSQKTQDVGN